MTQDTGSRVNVLVDLGSRVSGEGRKMWVGRGR